MPIVQTIETINSHVDQFNDKPTTASLTKSALTYNERLLVFNLMEQLNHLCRSVQRHRGYSMGLLAGNQTFVAGFQQLQRQMLRRVALISAFGKQSPSLFSHTDTERLHYAWNTIRDNWQQDSVLENFEFHSHFVDQLLLQMARLAEKIRQPCARYMNNLLSNNRKTEAPDDASLYGQLVYYTTRQLPRFIEMLGKIRALSVHVAEAQQSKEAYDKKLSYLLQCVSQDKPTIVAATDTLQQQLLSDLPALLTVKTYEHKLDYLVEKVTSDILDQTEIRVTADEMFALVTDIIDVYWRIVDDNLNLLHRWQKDDIEQWLQEG